MEMFQSAGWLAFVSLVMFAGGCTSTTFDERREESAIEATSSAFYTAEYPEIRREPPPAPPLAPVPAAAPEPPLAPRCEYPCFPTGPEMP